MQVINRDVELAIFEHLCRWKNEASTDMIEGVYVQSTKEQACLETIFEIGF